MTWKQERDLLLAQTMAFVQSVAGKATVGEGRLEARPKPVSSDQPFTVERPVDVLPARLSPIGRAICATKFAAGLRLSACASRLSIATATRIATR